MPARLPIVAALLALAIAVPATAQAQPLTLDLNFKGKATPDLKCKGLRASGNGTVTGNVFPGGATWHDDECINALSRLGTFIFTGAGAATAPNGDQLQVTYEATSPLPDLTLSLRPRGTFTITGGTGAFAGASGGGTLAVDVALLTQQVTGRAQGTLELP